MDLGLGHLTDLKTHLLNEALRRETTYDTALAALGRGVAGRMEQACNRLFLRTVGDTYECDADAREFSLPRYPVETISAIALRDSFAEGYVDQGAPSGLIEQLREKSGVVDFGAIFGARGSRIKFTYTGGFWYPTAPAVVVQRGSQAVDAAAASLAVTFDTEFASIPAVQLAVQTPEAGDTITAVAYEVTTTGFTARFSAPVPAAGYRLSFVAVQSPGEAADESVLQQAAPSLAVAATTKAVTFGTAFSSAPIVVCNVVAPSGGYLIAAAPTLVTASGFTALLGAAIPDTGYTLSWVAVAADGTAAASTLPAGATALPHDLKFAWLLQCEHLWKLRDKLGLSLATAPGSAAPALTLAGAELIPEVQAILRSYRRFTL